jgi:glutaredoxin
MTKEFFAQNKVDYTEYNVQADLEKRKEMLEKSEQMGVPVTIITDENGKEDIVIGFDQGTLIELLGL